MIFFQMFSVAKVVFFSDMTKCFCKKSAATLTGVCKNKKDHLVLRQDGLTILLTF